MKIETVLIDPKWEWGTIALDTSNYIFLTLHHPVHGPITSLILGATATSMVEGLSTLVDKPKSHQA